MNQTTIQFEVVSPQYFQKAIKQAQEYQEIKNTHHQLLTRREQLVQKVKNNEKLMKSTESTKIANLEKMNQIKERMGEREKQKEKIRALLAAKRQQQPSHQAVTSTRTSTGK